MRRLVYCIASTIDGFIAGPDGADPSGADGFWPVPGDYVSHVIENYPEILPAPARRAMGVTDLGTHFDTVVEGRNSYSLGLDAGIVDAFPHLRHLVFSRTLGANESVEVIPDDPVATVRSLKRESGKDIWLVGGATIAGALYSEIDRLIVKLAPITIGAGIPLFAAGFEPAHWGLTDVHRIDSGALFLTYDRA
ncbi:dihydrofolate reductase family protein [Tsukamurella sp. 8F]|uniref:dihydrofolate reductase family protein n=1 Tax=unclassified Tsukamurella TaxID=2633480 RepID=UPI0023B8FFCD|nr:MULTISPECIES: dihydrofolate reductase family protein [unclassified Tsukamurella]MDF0528708.1 dihydrofolate reductase family protein [Tsukamurella sp. 8J]MDF0585670.1 dihydrofolate reductase family protein [Tsukamurella sp. 8F]